MTSAEGPARIDSKRIKAFGQRTRIRILKYLSIHTVASTPELSKALGASEGQINYHINVLRECDYLVHVLTRKRNGKDTRFYGLERGVARAGPFLDGPSPAIAVETLALTEQHKRAALDAIRLTVLNLRLLAEQSRQLNVTTDVPLVSIELGIALLPATPSDSDDRSSNK